MREFIILYFLTNFSVLANSQNLIPNGDFESNSISDYSDPDSAFDFLDDWYQAGVDPVVPLYRGTPDLFDANNRWPASNPANFWNIAHGAYSGDYHVGIANFANYTGYFAPESLAAPLNEPLEAGAFYHVELQVRNKGVGAFQGQEPILCVSDQLKQIDILFDPDSIFVVLDDQNKNSYSDAAKAVTLRSEQMTSHALVGWHPVGTCFRADGGEQYIAVTTTRGNFSAVPPCEIQDEHWDVFYIYYYDIDNLKLTKMPEVIHVERPICAGRRTKINIDTLAKLPVMQNKIEYHWPDGKTDSINYVSEAGTYLINAVVDCTTIPIQLEITDFKCRPDVFVPNAFSPNGDGINDLLETFIVGDLPVVGYQFTVFNRWGAKIFSSLNIDDKWDGSFKGRVLDQGIYTWILEYTVDDVEYGLTDYRKNGDVLLVR